MSPPALLPTLVTNPRSENPFKVTVLSRPLYPLASLGAIRDGPISLSSRCFPCAMCKKPLECLTSLDDMSPLTTLVCAVGAFRSHSLTKVSRLFLASGPGGAASPLPILKAFPIRRFLPKRSVLFDARVPLPYFPRKIAAPEKPNS